MPSAPLIPSRIFVERAVRDLPLTRRILEKLPVVPTEIIDDAKRLKRPTDITWAKKGLILARRRADPLKEFRMVAASGGRPYYSLDLISNCHLECTYCILQSYLENNPLITVFTNIEEILDRLEGQLARIPEGSVVGTGRIADSLALDDVTGQARFLVPLFARQKKALLELKTKSDQIENLLGLNHGGRTVVGWSIGPPPIVESEEFKTASLEERLAAARRVSEEGYPVAFHFDPMIVHEGWRRHYGRLLQEIFDQIPPEKIAWMSVGTLRFPARQARIMRRRFPKNEAILEPLISTSRTVLHYPADLHEEMLSFLEEEIFKVLPRQKVYRCMDFL